MNYDAVPMGILITEIMNNPEQIIDSYGGGLKYIIMVIKTLIYMAYFGR